MHFVSQRVHQSDLTRDRRENTQHKISLIMQATGTNCFKNTKNKIAGNKVKVKKKKTKRRMEEQF